MGNWFDDFASEVKNDFVVRADKIQENEEFIDTGSYIFNALLSGSIFGGMSANKITAIAGESSTGKTFFTLAVCKNFLDLNPDGRVFYIDSESAITQKLMSERNIDTQRIYKADCVTVEQFRRQALQVVDKALATKEKDRTPILIVLDSLGMLSTEKETKDIQEGNSVRDMTKSQIIKGAFRVLTSKLGQANIPMIVTNHTYDVIGSYVPTKTMGGGSGLKYASSTIVTLSKSQEKDGKEVVGNIIKAKTEKSRLTKERQQVEVRLFYDHRGLDRYYGLLDLGLKYGIFESGSNGRVLIGGKSVYQKNVYQNPEEYFTEDVMHQLDAAANLEFKYSAEQLVQEETADGED